jgi:hypothetical protein
MTQRHEHDDFEASMRAAIDDVADGVHLVIDAVVGHGASLIAHVLQRVDQLVDDVVADAADVARQAEALFTAACARDEETEN